MQTDEQLLAQIQAGDRKAFDALYDRYQRPLFSFILRYVNHWQDAEEIFHEAFVKVLRGRESFGEGGFRPWLYTVARNLSLNRLRSARRSAEATLRLVEEAPYATDSRSPELSEVAEGLPPHLSDVYQLRLAGMSYPEIAHSLQIPVGTVKSRAHEMVKALRKKVKLWNAK